MAKIDFQPVFDYIDQKVAVLKEEILLEVRSELRGIRTDIANLTGQMKAHNDEMKICNYRVTRLEQWGLSVGKKVEIPLEL